MDHKKLRNLQYVRRFNFHHCNRYQSVAEHSYFVAMIALDIADALGAASAEERFVVIGLALLHDATEAVTGDIPYLVRREIERMMPMRWLEEKAYAELQLFDPFRYVATDRQDIVDLADKVELKLYLQEERRSGNMSLMQIEREVWTQIQGHPVYMRSALQLDGLFRRLGLEQVERAELPEEMSH